MNKGFVYIAGCGPGHIDFITVKCLELIKTADCIIYDALIDNHILDYAKDTAQLINVGKRKGHHSYSQEVINNIIIEQASSYPTVLRLKGGDPFVFGRGGEECLALQKAHIDYQVIPGLTSSIAVPESVGIPVTHRQVSRSFTVITGHSAENDLSQLPFELYAQLGGTLVFLMGMTHLNDIVHLLLINGMSPSTPISLIINGTYSDEYRLTGQLETIIQLAKDNPSIHTPGIIVVGETASFDLRSLHIPHRKAQIGIVGTEDFVNKLSLQVNQLGMLPIKIPLLNINPLNNMLDDSITHLNEYEYIVFTSKNTIQLFFKYLYQHDYDIRLLAQFKFIVIGKASGEYLKKYHIHYDYCPSVYTSEGLGQLIIDKKLNHLFIPRALKGNDVLSTLLDQYHIHYKEIPLYDTSFKEIDSASYNFDYLIFASSQGVKGYYQNNHCFNAHKIICIGQYTYKELIKYRKENVLIAPIASSEGIIDILKKECYE